MQNARVLGMSFVLITVFMAVEYIAGKVLGSLALLADAGHMLNDSFGLLLALLALTIAQKYQKPLALINGLSLLWVGGWIVIEALDRLQNPSTIDALPMIGVAALGLLVNIVVAALLHKDSQHDLNMQAAYWHVLADLAGSVVAIVAGAFAYFWGILWVDAVASLMLAVLIIKSGARISHRAFLALQNKHAQIHSDCNH